MSKHFGLGNGVPLNIKRVRSIAARYDAELILHHDHDGHRYWFNKADDGWNQPIEDLWDALIAEGLATEDGLKVKS